MKKQILYLLFIMFIRDLCAEYRLVWFDEFDRDGLPDSQKWSYDVGGDGWGNNELQYYRRNDSSTARVENGCLIIEAHKKNHKGSDYISARLVSRGKGDWRYGRFVVRAKLPSGRGSWPAVWMLPTDWEYGAWPSSGEIDIMEHVGYDMGKVHASLHTRHGNGSNGLNETRHIIVEGVNTAFHVYALEWTPDRITASVDGVHYFESLKSEKDWTQWPYDNRFHIILNLAVGGNWGGLKGVDAEIWPQRMEIDYVRVYQRSTVASEVSTRQDTLPALR